MSEGPTMRNATDRMDKMAAGVIGEPLPAPDGTEGSPDTFLDYLVTRLAHQMALCTHELDKRGKAEMSFNHHIPLEELLLRPVNVRMAKKMLRFPKLEAKQTCSQCQFSTFNEAWGTAQRP